MQPATPKSVLTPMGFAIWTVLMVVFLGLTVWGITYGTIDTLTGTLLFFFPALIIATSFSWKGEWRRSLPAILAITIVSVWPLYRWFALGEWRPLSVFLGIAGFVGALMGGIAALDYAKHRGWAFNSPARTRVSAAAMLSYFVLDKTGWAAGVWHSVAFWAWTSIFLLTVFWRSPRTAAQS